MARHCGISTATVGRIWKAFALPPHRCETFRLSRDPPFIEKVRDIVGLYLSPPERAAVLCVDEKSQIQALNRIDPILPGWRSHDCRRNGTTSLFAALNAATGEVIGKCHRRHRSVEFRKFPGIIDRAVPEALEIHLALDNCGTHRTALVHNWLARRERLHLHFRPTSASWINLVERWFGEITRKRIRRGSSDSTRGLELVIGNCLEGYNEDPRPFVWTKSADEILESLKTY